MSPPPPRKRSSPPVPRARHARPPSPAPPVEGPPSPQARDRRVPASPAPRPCSLRSGSAARLRSAATATSASFEPVSNGSNSFIYAANGSLLGSIPAEKNRQPVTLAQTSRWMPKATVAIEDRRFYSHGGVDFQGIGRAIVNDVRAGSAREGGSTITQQLVRNLYIQQNERTLRRKVVEACLAVKLSRNWSKDKILAEYMNTVYYGNHAYGVEAAARTYFSRPAKQAHTPPVGAPRGAAAGAVGLRPVRQPGPRDQAAERRAGGALSRTARSPSGNYQEAIQSHRPQAEARTDLHEDPRALLLRLRARRAREEVRRGDGSLGRPQGLYDDRPPPPTGGEQGDPRTPSTTAPTRLRRLSRSTPGTARSRR